MFLLMDLLDNFLHLCFVAYVTMRHTMESWMSLKVPIAMPKISLQKYNLCCWFYARHHIIFELEKKLARDAEKLNMTITSSGIFVVLKFIS